MDAPTEFVTVELPDGERQLLREGVLQWGGPTTCSEEMAVALGFDDVNGLLSTCRRLGDSIGAGNPLTRRDWSRALLATEVVFSSYLLGAAWDWSIVTGLSDDQTLRTLRSLQRRLAAARALTYVGTPPSPASGSSQKS